MGKNMKRILKVTINTMMDSDGDTSYLGEYSNSYTSEFSIDRSHDIDCPQQSFVGKPGVEKLERVIAYLETVRQLGEPPDNQYWCTADESQDTLVELQREIEEECTCGRGFNLRNEYKYFNPNVDNYKGLDHEDMVKACTSDFERMESCGQLWWYVGIRATAEVQMTENGPVQVFTSGGLWGIESDSDEDYVKDIETDELGELREQLKAIGFGTRAISKAFKTLDRKDT